MARQLPFDLTRHPGFGREDFAVSQANAPALAQITAWADWPQGKLVLHGPSGAGKTHLAHIWAAEADALLIPAQALDTAPPPTLRLVIEDVPQIAGDPAREEALFHLHNHLAASGGALLMTGRGAPRDWGIVLPDLASRIAGTLAIALDPPDEALLTYVLAKLFADRQLVPDPRVIAYLTTHMERSFAAANRVVAALDMRALSENRSITRGMARQVLDAMDQAALPLDDPDAPLDPFD